jgi:hypothetical protein
MITCNDAHTFLPLHAIGCMYRSPGEPNRTERLATYERAGLKPSMAAAAAPPAGEGPAGKGPAHVRPMPTSVLDDPASTLQWELEWEQWEVEADGADGEGSEAGWIRYPPLQQLAIESAFADGTTDSVCVTVMRWEYTEYTIRFDRGE